MIDRLLTTPKRIQRFVEEVLIALRRVSWTALLLSGLAIAIVATASALLIPTKLAAVIVASLGSSVGTAVVTLVIPKLAGLTLEHTRKQLREEASKHVAAEKELADLRRMRLEYLQAREEQLRLRRLRIDVSRAQPIHELGLAAIPIETTHVVRKTLKADEAEGITEYLGAFHLRAVSKWGIDLKRIRIRALEGGRLEVSGISCVHLGSADEKTTVMLSEVRRRATERSGLLGKVGFGKKVEVVQVRSSSGEIDEANWAIGSIEAKPHEEDYRKDLLSRVALGVLSTETETLIRRLGEEWLRVMLAPLGRDLVFTEHSHDQAREFFQFIRAHNEAIEKRIGSLEAKKQATRRLLSQASGKPSE